MLEQVASKLKENDAKATLGDYIRLVQLQKELDEDEQPREIKVTWIEPPAVMAEVERELAEMQDAEPVEPKLREKPAVEKSENEA